MFRAIEVCTDLTERKKAIIKEVLASYRETAKKIASYQWKLFFQLGAFNRKANVKHIQSDLSERYKYTCVKQVQRDSSQLFLTGENK